MKNLQNLLFVLLLLFSNSISGQNWEQYFIPPNVTSLNDLDVYVDKTIDGEYVLITSSTNNPKPIMRIDDSGAFNWKLSANGALPTNTQNIIATNDDNYTTTVDNFGQADLFSIKIDTNGNPTSAFPYTEPSSAQLTLFDIIKTQDGNFVALLSELNGSTLDIRLMKFDFDNGEIWSTYPNLNGSISTTSTDVDLGGLTELSNGDLVFAGGSNNFNVTSSVNISELFIIKTDNLGNKIGSNSYNYPGTAGPGLISPDLAVSTNGEFALVACEDAQTNLNLLKIDTQLNELWRTALWSIGSTKDVSIDATDNIIVVGEQNNHGTIAKYNSSGTHLWTRQHISVSSTQYLSSNYSHLEAMNDGGYMIFGGVTSLTPNYHFEVYITRLDSNGVLFNTALEGNVYKDDNLDCAFNSTEIILPAAVLLQIVEGTDTNYHFTDNNGAYHIPIDVGTYQLSAVAPSTSWANCPPQTITLNANDTLTQDLGLRPISTCHNLSVNITTPVLIRCFSNIYTVSYQNVGTQTETGVYIEVALDNFLIVNSTSIPYTSNGNIYTFNIGSLNIAETGDFTINVTVDCNAVLGQAHCSDATIYPNQICSSNNTIWNGATIVTNAFCSPNDSVTFELTNIGMGDMTQARDYYVIEDQVLPYQGTYQLQQGENINFTLPANGYIYQIQADQEITHPWGNNMPSAITYGCNNGNLITNALNQLSLSDNLNFQDIDCQVNVGSYDPNDKQGFPNGYGNEHYITKNDNIEYLIRFQNTGTYTAFNVRIEDEIDMTTLDLSTLQIQGSSHSYEVEIKDGNILVFNFNNIMLPDSNTNEPESHGYIRFKINQKANNPIGIIIENTAGIYFDFNEPIITNTTFHTVGENFIQVVSTKSVKEKLANVNVFPNPFSTQATFEIETDERYKNLTLTVFNVMGQAVKTIQANDDNQIILDRNGLTSGVYFYQIQSEGLILDSGKLMVK